MATSASGASAYATPGDLVARVDVRSLGDLVQDVGVRMMPAQVLQSPVVTAALQEASGWVESACTVAGSYQINPLANPPINDLALLAGNSAQVLVGLVCNIAFWILWNRRPHMEPGAKPPPQVDVALQMLQDLSDGKRIFGILEHQQAGVVNDVIEDPTIYQARQGPVHLARRLFGRRAADFTQPG